MTRVAILWHMHQPFYQDLLTGEHILPWVRLHGLKDYWGMVAVLREFPEVKVTFNLVPSLLVQLEAFAGEQARDRHLEIGLKPADQLTDEERAFAIENFFHAHRPRMIDPYPRYRELLERRGAAGHDGALSGHAQLQQFSAGDLRDLQVWHKLAWVDAYYFERDARVQQLVQKGRDFSEDDKQVLRQIELEILRQTVPEYRDAVARGQVEVSTSPFYHPILPLLCDTDVYLRTHPHSRMPRERFRHPEDAAGQLARAIALHERLFGKRPAGLWPSEGSVSDAMVPLVAAAGLAWMATDEEILARTIGRGYHRDAQIYRPHKVGAEGGPQVACGFRDHELSDLIGFVYSSWGADAAADDFVRRLVEAGNRARSQGGGEEPTIFVILDGENAWEHYEGQGRPFLRALYRRLQHHPDLRTVTMAEACAPAQHTLPSIFPGSWINGDFYIWIGHADDHRAWGQLADARRALSSPPSGLPQASLDQAHEEMLIAEGSDWFWWYGDDHSSDHDLEFDDLFRRHVRNIYRALEKPVPEELYVSNITTQPAPVRIDRPTGLISPRIDGQISSYFEWLGAGLVEPAATAGAMHQVADRVSIRLIEFGCDREALYVRVDGSRPMAEVLADGYGVSLNFLEPSGVRISVTQEPSSVMGVTSAAGPVLEVRIPFSSLGRIANDPIAFFVALNHGDAEIEHQPRHRPIELDVPDQEFRSIHWSA